MWRDNVNRCESVDSKYKGINSIKKHSNLIWRKYEYKE